MEWRTEASVAWVSAERDRACCSKGRTSLLVGGGVLQALRQRRPLLLESLRVGALVGHLREFHDKFLLVSRGGCRFSYCCRL